jgi:twitching motility protein PilT
VLKHVPGEPLSPGEAKHLIDPLVSDTIRNRYEQQGNIDFAVNSDGERFRVNLFKAGGYTHAAIRRVKGDIPSFTDLHLPPVYAKVVESVREGLVLVVGTTGCGKSSTLAAMLEHINQSRAEHIISVEDPVEYRFVPSRSIISQRELGIDVGDYATALRYIVREDPDIIFIGELRDRDTIMAAIQAAETGHLVFASMHTADTTQAFSRMLEFFAPDERSFIRGALANTLQAICAQRLLPTLEDVSFRLAPATEVLLGNHVVREKIRDGLESDFATIIATREDGMHNFTQSLADLVKREWVAMSLAMDYAPNRELLAGMLKGMEVKVSTVLNRVKTRAS